jgi:hypothetical protein
MMTPMARSTTLPRIANFLNSWSISTLHGFQVTGSPTSKAATWKAARNEILATRGRQDDAEGRPGDVRMAGTETTRGVVVVH